MYKMALYLSALFFLSVAASPVQTLTPFEDSKASLWGYKNATGEIVIEPRYQAAGPFSEHGIAPVADASGWQYIDRKGVVIISPFIFDNGPDPFHEGLARFKKDGKFGFFNESGAPVIMPRFDFAAPFSEGYAAFCEGCSEKTEGEHRTVEGGRWGFINMKGDVVIQPRFEKAESFEKGKTEVLLDGRWFLLIRKGW